MKKENRLFVVLYDEDSFRGITVPLQMTPIIEGMKENLRNVIDNTFLDYDDYRDCEVEYSSYAKDGSSGTNDIENIEELIEEFSRNNKVVTYLKGL